MPIPFKTFLTSGLAASTRSWCSGLRPWGLGVFMLSACLAPVRAGDETLPPSPVGQPTRVLETLPASPAPFHKGESLRFVIRYGFIQAGAAWLEVPEVVDWKGHASWKLVAKAQSTGFFDSVYRVKNYIESVWDQKTLSSHYYFEDRSEGGRKRKNTIEIDEKAKVARYANGKTYKVPSMVQDALSAFYYTRFQALPIGGSVFCDYHASKATQKMEVKILGRERVTTPAGTFNCVMIEPMLQKAGGIFRNKGRLVIWITDDARRIPVLMKSKVTIGSVRVELQEIKTGEPSA